ncbi:DUF72 domain-containing protein [Glacieibacterium frigidum]|uniref:DUF72 domain-containing protein n=1 Tax=Glacieibacterium frigidum TaxID=2593303 RepID=A0A552UFF1_9SPHN|nr:DUF72 domain-containing protein [Glacieibacterium frigidum]TRW16957.1 DUF72 domain-containing protein [Glacieibacterium frigidum]
MTGSCRIGTAGWSIPGAVAGAFPDAGSHLERYATVFPAVEINSSFHRPHRRSTYERWAAATPANFRFAVKLPKQISHVLRLVDAEAPLATFLDEAGGLGDRLGVLLLQLPPKLAFDEGIAAAFFEMLQARRPGGAALVCEPRHASWFTPDAEACLTDHEVARVAADPVLAPGGERPGGWPGLAYHRLHGSPRVYHSAYGPERLDALAATFTPADTWCIFDNTASSAATGDALYLQSLVSPDQAPRSS